MIGVKTEINLQEIENDINTRNFRELNETCTAVYCHKNKNNELKNVILKVTPNMYMHIKSNNNRVYIGSPSYRTVDDFNILPCYNCGRFGHSGKKCNNPKLCLVRAEDHATKD